MEVLVLLLVVVGMVSVSESGTTCPDRISILPCSCFNQWPYTEINCYSSKSNQDQLKNAFAAISSNHMVIDKFIFNGYLSTVPERLFRSTVVHYMMFRVNGLKTVSDDAFDGLSAIHGLWFINTQFGKFPIRAVSRLKLTSLAVSGDRIAVIPERLFEQMVYGSALRELQLNSNGIETIGKHAFYNLVSLESLSLKDNVLKSLPEQMLPISSGILASRMRSLILQKNKLERVPVDALKMLPKSAKVDLSVNNITTGDFYQILQLNLQIDLLANKLNCDCNMMIVAIFNENNPEELKVRGHCNLPTTLKGKELKKLKTSDFPKC